MRASHQDVSFEADGETLTGTKVSPLSGKKTISLLSLHGAGTAVRERVFYLADALAPIGATTFAFDFSGHGTSSGALHESTLARRIVQASAGLRAAELDQPLLLMGNSMGGFIAASLATKVNSDGLILMCPALYDDSALDVPFDHRFTELIRAQDSYERSTLPNRLRNYKGHVLLLIGSDDRVIPHRVIEIYLSSFDSAKSKELIRISGAPHRLHLWAAENARSSASILSPIHRLITKVLNSAKQ
jgi:pimeloyl-ACP methyl ester carboxylesterase